MFKRLMERRRPKYANSLGFVWPLLETRWFGLAVVLRTQGDRALDSRAECSRVRLVLDGEYLEHRELARRGKNEPAEKTPRGAFRYGNEFGLWACIRREKGALSYEPEGRRGGVELLDARTTGEKIVDFPRWMAHKEVVFDSKRQVVMLVLAWGGHRSLEDRYHYRSEEP